MLEFFASILLIPGASMHRNLITGLIAAVMFNLPGSSLAATLKIGGTGAGLGTMRQLGEAFQKRFPSTLVEVHPSVGSTGGIRAVIAGKLDIGISARPLNPEELGRGITESAYAKTPFVLAVKKNLFQTELDFNEVIGIYDGSLSRWKDGSAIRVILRPATESDTLLLQKFIPGMDVAMEKAYKRRGPPLAVTDQDTADKIQKISGAVGPSTLALILGENRPLKALALNNVPATVENMANGTYPMSKTLSLVTAANPGKEVQSFIDFIRSGEGSAILSRTGHLMLKPN